MLWSDLVRLEFGGVPLLMRLIHSDGWAQMHGVKLISHLALQARNSKALEQAKARDVIEVAARSVPI